MISGLPKVEQDNVRGHHQYCALQTGNHCSHITHNTFRAECSRITSATHQ